MERYPIATIIMADGAEITITLRPDQAPNTVSSFISLANRGMFDGHAIQRIVPGYVVDASYNAFGKEECEYLIENESISHGFPNSIKVEPGVIAMGGYEQGIAGGEFFFPLAYHKKLDGYYPAFGVIESGFNEVRRWESVPLRPVEYPQDPQIVVNEPVVPLIIESIRVETLGISYPEPKKLEMKERPPSW